MFTIGWLHVHVCEVMISWVYVNVCMYVHEFVCIYVTKMSQILLEKLIVAQLLNEFSAFYGKWKIITVLTSLPIFCARLIQFITEICFFNSYFNIILSSRPIFSKKSIPFRFSYQILY